MAHSNAAESGAARSGRGQLLPEITLTSLEGQPVRLSDFRGHLNLVILTAGTADGPALLLADAISAHQSDLDSQEARAVVVLHSPPGEALEIQQNRHWSFMVLPDQDGQARAALGSADSDADVEPALIIADRFGEVYAEYPGQKNAALPGIQEILDWLSFINSQCPECGAAEWLG